MKGRWTKATGWVYQVALVGVLILTSGCMYQTMPNGTTKRVIAPQVGANVLMLDLCGPSGGMIYGTDGTSAGGLKTVPGQEFWVALRPSNGLNTYSASITYVKQGDGRSGTVSRSFPIYYREGSQKFQWILAPDGVYSGGGQNIYIDRCPLPVRR